MRAAAAAAPCAAGEGTYAEEKAAQEGTPEPTVPEQGARRPRNRGGMMKEVAFARVAFGES